MGLNLFTFFLFGVIFLVIMALIGNSGQTATTNIIRQQFLANCPMPIYNGVATANSVDGPNGGILVNYTVTQNTASITNDFNGTRFECFLDTLSNPQQHVNTRIMQYGYSTFWGAIPYGWLGWASDSLGMVGQKIQAWLTLTSYFMTPVNFNILGYTITDMSGIALGVVIFIYIFSYVSIGLYGYMMVRSGHG